MARWSSARAIDFLLAVAVVLIWAASALLALFALVLIDSVIEPVRTHLLLTTGGSVALAWIGRALHRSLAARNDDI
jgi:hypothetical protein